MHDKYLALLSEKFPNANAVRTELINLRAILSLPKGTEHFVSDLHGASTAFIHMVKNASGVIRRKVDDAYGDTISEQEKRALCAMIYYPDERLQQPEVPFEEGFPFESREQFLRRRLEQVVEIMRRVTVKYTRSKVRKMLPRQFAYIIEELLYESNIEGGRQDYYHAIIEAIMQTDCAEQVIVAICYLIHSLVIDTFHIVGDIFDRGPGAQKILDVLDTIRDYDIQWGNHDIEWMGAAAGNRALIATVLRISIRYSNIETLEEGYGINLLPLASFAMQTYGEDPCTIWQTKDFEHNPRLTRSAQLMAKMHKAISIIQFKLEGQTILRHPEYQMNDRLLLHKIDLQAGTITMPLGEGGAEITYPLLDTYLPTIDPEHPYDLSLEEEELMNQLARSFRKSEKLQKHLRLLYRRGSLYLVRNGFLLYHAAIPMNADGSFTEVEVLGERVAGKDLMTRVDRVVRLAYFGEGTVKDYALDYMWYLWTGPQSPLYNKDKMTTFECYFLSDKAAQHEEKGAYYELANRRDICEKILMEFGLNPEDSRIINGHIPVRTIKGETPMRAEGKRFVIDGGFSKPYQEKTGIAGYTLIYNSFGVQLVEHEEFESQEQAIRSGSDIHNRIQLTDFSQHRMLNRDTDMGHRLLEQISDLELLLDAYRSGRLKERL